MLRLSAKCPRWNSAALASAFDLSWQPSRNAATLQRRKPARMALSERVARGPSTNGAGGKSMGKSRNTPFGGMNATQAPRQLRDERNMIPAANRQRQSRSRSGKSKSKGHRDPMKALKMQRRLADVSYASRNRIKQEIIDRDSFDDFRLLPSVKESIASQALAGLTDITPTPVQRLAIPALLGMDSEKRRSKGRPVVEAKKEMKQFLLAAETGSGKTLAYVLPILDSLKRAEIVGAQESLSKQANGLEAKARRRESVFEVEQPEVEHSSAGRPRAIILLPTAELVSQVGSLVKSLSHTIKFRSAMISAAFSGTVIRNRLFSPSGIDILISTPHLLSSIAESDPNVLSQVTHLVIDEADSLLDRSFSPITSGIIDRAAPSLKQLILCSATIPRSLDSYLNKRYPETKRLATPNLHAIPRRVQLTVIDIDKIPYQGNRDLACAQTIWDIGKEIADSDETRERKIVVFVNEREKATELTEFLRAKGINANALSRDSDERKQSDILTVFTGSAKGNPRRSDEEQEKQIEDKAATPFGADSAGDLAEIPTTQASRKLSNTSVLVMTDIGSRGIDTVLVKHVILYDVPHTSIDFIHRLGRVGRMGRRGRGIVLVGKNDRKDVVREVREGMFRGQALI